jgi:putative mRNA 3-end processing factor
VNTVISEYFARGKPVVLMGYPLGKAQIISYMFSSWDPIYVHSAVHKMNQVHEKLGVRFGDNFIPYDVAIDQELLNKKPWIMISPLQNGRSTFVSNLKKKYDAGLIAFSGWSIEPRYKYSLSVDYAFPLSDHCDFDDLIKFVALCKPRKIYTVHGFASEFALHLRKIGYDASPLSRFQKSLRDFIKEAND